MKYRRIITSVICVFIAVVLLILGCVNAAQEHAVPNNNGGLPKQWDKAIADFRESMNINPVLAFFFYNSGLTDFYKGEYDKAIADYTKAIELDPKFALAYYNRGLAYRAMGHQDKFNDDMKKWKELMGLK